MTINVQLRLILIKNPNRNFVEMSEGIPQKYIYTKSKIVLDEVLSLSDSYGLENKDTTDSDSAGPVNFTKNHGALKGVIENLARKGAQNFQELILHAF